MGPVFVCKHHFEERAHQSALPRNRTTKAKDKFNSSALIRTDNELESGRPYTMMDIDTLLMGSLISTAQETLETYHTKENSWGQKDEGL